MNENTVKALNALINTFMEERGCSRLIAAGYAAEACVNEYNQIQARLGSTAQSRIVDAEWLKNKIPSACQAARDKYNGVAI